MPDIRIYQSSFEVPSTFAAPTPAPASFDGRVLLRAPSSISVIPVQELVANPSSSVSSSGTPSAPSSTSDTPFFPSPTGSDCESCSEENSKSLQFTKNAVEGALIVVAVILILSATSWRFIRLHRNRRPLRDFFRVHSHPHPHSTVPSRPPTVPRTTGLPPTRPPPASVIYDSLAAPPVPLVSAPSGARRSRGRRTRAGDIDARGRRGRIAHPDDPDEELPEYDDKDVLPRYQDLEAGVGRAAAGTDVPSPLGAGGDAGASGDAGRGSGEDMGRVGGAGQMVGVGTAMMGRSANGEGGTSDTDPLVTRMRPSTAAAGTSEDDHAYPPPMSSAESHEGHGVVQRHA
ncbi:hypothetical protein BD414DRAFT_581217 [Trametes punicea]|nr:hypothetical protein BD414DRAFT_581217 [Trametes punicea]